MGKWLYFVYLIVMLGAVKLGYDYYQSSVKLGDDMYECEKLSGIEKAKCEEDVKERAKNLGKVAKVVTGQN